MSENGHPDVTMAEACNIHYRLLKNLAVRGSDSPEKLDEELIEDFLNCQDLANEFVAGGLTTVSALTQKVVLSQWHGRRGRCGLKIKSTDT